MSEETIEHVVTAEDLALNDGALEEVGIAEGDIVELPVEELEDDQEVSEPTEELEESEESEDDSEEVE